MNNVDGLVFVIDDDESIREALKSLIRSVGLRVETCVVDQLDQHLRVHLSTPREAEWW